MYTRIVTVNGYDEVQYLAGWTRKLYFFKGDRGWVCDADYNSDSKDWDFDDAMALIEKGWMAFVDNYLWGNWN